MANQYWEEVPCNLCGSTNYSILYEPTCKDFDPREVFSASGGVRGTQRIVKCRQCNLVYVNPRLKPEFVISAYSNAVDQLYVSQEEGRLKTFEKGLKLVESYAPRKGKILDVGCAAGFFVKVAKEHGWDACGVEPGRWMGEWGRQKNNINIIDGTLREAKFAEGCFDVVTMWDVLEHTPDPVAELAEVYRILKPGGILVINFPNVGSKLARLAGRNWWFFLSVHLYHFTPQTITTMLEKNNLSVLSLRRHFQTLELEHLIKMVGLYSRIISDLGLKISSLLRIGKLQIPYYASQANVVAIKNIDR